MSVSKAGLLIAGSFDPPKYAPTRTTLVCQIMLFRFKNPLGGSATQALLCAVYIGAQHYVWFNGFAGNGRRRHRFAPLSCCQMLLNSFRHSSPRIIQMAAKVSF